MSYTSCISNARMVQKSSDVKAISVSRRVQCRSQNESGMDRRKLLQSGGMMYAAYLAGASPMPALADFDLSEWKTVTPDLQDINEIQMVDIAFTDEQAKHGFIGGSRQLVLETNDGGETWIERQIPALTQDSNQYRIQGMSFFGDEGWLVTKPTKVLHSEDAGATWNTLPVGKKLPGVPNDVIAKGPGCAELVSSKGAIYGTQDGGQTWKALVTEQVDATLNRTVSSGISGASYYDGTLSSIARGDQGAYVATTPRGNFYLTYQPGEEAWVPHNRPGNRRVQNMGYTPDNRLWLATRGGDLYLSSKDNAENFEQAQLNSRGFGILNLGYRTNSEWYAVGGSGSLFKSTDKGNSWKRDK